MGVTVCVCVGCVKERQSASQAERIPVHWCILTSLCIASQYICVHYIMIAKQNWCILTSLCITSQYICVHYIIIAKQNWCIVPARLNTYQSNNHIAILQCTVTSCQAVPTCANYLGLEACVDRFLCRKCQFFKPTWNKLWLESQLFMPDSLWASISLMS